MATLSRVGELVRRHDPDRFLTALFAPLPGRETLFALYAFHGELARAAEGMREPAMGLIRLQWWREVVEGAHRRHEVADPLRAAIDAGALRPEDLLALLDARETDPPETESEWRAHLGGTAGALAATAARSLGAADTAAAFAAGVAYGAAGTARNRALAGQPPIPALDTLAVEHLAQARQLPLERAALPAALPAVLAARDMKRGRPVSRRPLSDQLAVVAAALRRRL